MNRLSSLLPSFNCCRGFSDSEDNVSSVARDEGPFIDRSLIHTNQNTRDMTGNRDSSSHSSRRSSNSSQHSRPGTPPPEYSENITGQDSIEVININQESTQHSRPNTPPPEYSENITGQDSIEVINSNQESNQHSRPSTPPPRYNPYRFSSVSLGDSVDQDIASATTDNDSATHLLRDKDVARTYVKFNKVSNFEVQMFFALITLFTTVIIITAVCLHYSHSLSNFFSAVHFLFRGVI